MARKKADYENIDNKWELVAYVIKKHWWKVLIILMCGGLVATGFTVTCGNKTFQKDALYKVAE